MSHRAVLIAAAILACTVGICAALAIGMRVQPGGALLQRWPVGERRELPVPLVVFNDDEQPHEVAVSACKPSEIGSTPPRGYGEIPDPAWLTFEPAEIEVPAGGRAAMKMFLSVPSDEKYRNAHWSVSLAVRSSPAKAQKIGLALYPRFEIETEAKETRVAPDGELVITPSFVSVEDVAPGEQANEVCLKVWNNTKKVQHCRARILGRPPEGEKPIIRLSHGQVWIPDASWVSVKAPTFDVPAGGFVEVPVEVALPDRAGDAGVWEAVLLVDVEDGPQAFARIRVAAAKGR